MRQSASRSGQLNLRALTKDLLYETSFGQGLLARFTPAAKASQSREYQVELPQGYPAARIRIRVSTPKLSSASLAGFSDHVLDAEGRPTDTIVAVMTGGFVISHDLGNTWETVRIRDARFRRHQFLRMKAIGDSEFLAVAVAERWRPGAPRVIDNLVLNAEGKVLAAQRMNGSQWHGPRSADIANGTLMYAEYPYEAAGCTPAERAPSRVLRSRDRGRSWEVVFERAGTQMRHFHLLQARPGFPGEWWLTSGDSPSESRIWVSKDDGDTWKDLTSGFNDPVILDGLAYPRTLFRLTDLAWEKNGVVWGTDDHLARNRFPDPGARMVRSPTEELTPIVSGKAKWPIRNIVDVGGFYVVLTQGSFRDNDSPEERMPGVYLMPKQPVGSAPGMVQLFNVEVHSQNRTGFTYSRASRAAKDGTFFTYRASTDLFPFGHKLLKWEVSLS